MVGIHVLDDPTQIKASCSFGMAFMTFPLVNIFLPDYVLLLPSLKVIYVL